MFIALISMPDQHDNVALIFCINRAHFEWLKLENYRIRSCDIHTVPKFRSLDFSLLAIRRSHEADSRLISNKERKQWNIHTFTFVTFSSFDLCT